MLKYLNFKNFLFSSYKSTTGIFLIFNILKKFIKVYKIFNLKWKNNFTIFLEKGFI